MGVETMNYKLLGLVALLAGPMAANAQTEILDYTGSPFSSVSVEGNDAGAPNPAQNTGELVLSSPLGDNLHNFAVTPVSFRFDGVPALDSNNSSFTGLEDVASFRFSTDAHGMLTAWDIVVRSVVLRGYTPESSAGVTITNAGDSFFASNDTTFCGQPPFPPPGCFNISASNGTPGVWTTPAPEIDPASAASGLTLLLGGLAVLRGRRKLGAAPHAI
jgi:hypothetical protein